MSSLSPAKLEALAKRDKKSKTLHVPAFGIKLEYSPQTFSQQFCEEMKEVLMIQFLLNLGSDLKGDLTIISGIDEPKSDVDRALNSLELITNMVGPELFKDITKSWVEKNLKDCSFGSGDKVKSGKKMVLVSNVIKFGVYFIAVNGLKYFFFLVTRDQISQFDQVMAEFLSTIAFDEPEVVLSALVGEVFQEYFDDANTFSISFPEGYEKVTDIPQNEGSGDNVTRNNSICAVEFSLKQNKEVKAAHGITIRVVIEKTKIKFSDFIELFKLQLTKSRVLQAAVKETPSKMCFNSAFDFEYVTDGVSHLKRVGIVNGHAVVLSIDHFGVDALEPKKLFLTVLKSFRHFGSVGPQTHVTSLKFVHFPTDFAISYPNFCKVLYHTSNVVVISFAKKPAEDSSGCFIQVLDYKAEPRVPPIEDIFQELVQGYQATCTIVYKQEPKDTNAFGPDCRVAELLLDGTWFVNPIMQTPHSDSKAVIRVVKTPRYIFVFAFINHKASFNKTWEQFGRLMLDSVQFA